MDPNDNSQHLPQTGKTFGVPQDEEAHADLDLQDDKDEALQDAYSDETASESVGMPEAELKEGLDKIAFDERSQADTPASDDSGDDCREEIEDLDENDKR